MKNLKNYFKKTQGSHGIVGESFVHNLLDTLCKEKFRIAVATAHQNIILRILFYDIIAQ